MKKSKKLRYIVRTDYFEKKTMRYIEDKKVRIPASKSDYSATTDWMRTSLSRLCAQKGGLIDVFFYESVLSDYVANVLQAL